MNIPEWNDKLTTRKVVAANPNLEPYMGIMGSRANLLTWVDIGVGGHILDNPDLLVEAMLYRAIIDIKHEVDGEERYKKLVGCDTASQTMGRVAGYVYTLKMTPTGYDLLIVVGGVRVRVTKDEARYSIAVEDLQMYATQSRSVSDMLWHLYGVRRSPIKYKLDKMIAYRELSIGGYTGVLWIDIDYTMVNGKLRVCGARCNPLPATRPAKGAGKLIKKDVESLSSIVDTIVLMEPKCSKVPTASWSRGLQYNVAHHMVGKVKYRMTIDDLQELLTVELQKGVDSANVPILVPNLAQLSYFVRVIRNLNVI
jgi:hypothetical protein